MKSFVVLHKIIVAMFVCLVLVQAGFSMGLIINVAQKNRIINTIVSQLPLEIAPINSSYNLSRYSSIRNNTEGVKSAMITIRYQGVIGKIETKGGVWNQERYYQVMVVLLNEDKKGISYFYYSADDLTKLKVYKRIRDIIYPANIKDLEIGDSVNIEEMIDPTESFPNNYIGGTIIINK